MCPCETVQHRRTSVTVGGDRMKWLLSVVIVCMVVLTGCGPFIPSASAAQPNTLVVVRENPLHQPGIPSFTKTIYNVSAIREMYNELIHLRQLPSGPISCPSDNGVSYTLTFKHGDSVVLIADAEDTGCEIVRLSKGWHKTRTTMPQAATGSQGGQNFWSLLYKSLGIQQRLPGNLMP